MERRIRVALPREELDPGRSAADEHLAFLHTIIEIRLRFAKDRESRRHLSWMVDMITALNLLRRRTGQDGAFDVADYVNHAAQMWAVVCASRPVRVEAKFATGLAPNRLAAPCALILHELLANAVNHAFPHGGPGLVQIVGGTENGVLTLSVVDDGVGFADLPSQRGIGLGLAAGLAEWMGGDFLVIAAAPGAQVRVRLPISTLGFARQ